MRDLCDQNGSVLIFDEVVAGFRLSIGGGQKYYGVTPDLTVLGKIIAHGYAAAGAVGGKNEIMECCPPQPRQRQESFHRWYDVSQSDNGNRGLFCLEFIQEYQAIEKAADYATKLTNALNDLFATRKESALLCL